MMEFLNISQYSIDSARSPDDNSVIEEKFIRSILCTLPTRYEHCLRLRFFNGMTYQEIGKVQGVGRDRTRQVTLRGLRMLRHRSRTRDFFPSSDKPVVCHPDGTSKDLIVKDRVAKFFYSLFPCYQGVHKQNYFDDVNRPHWIEINEPL